MVWLILFCLLPVAYIIARFFWELLRVGDLSSKAVLITGCDSGFGRELALRCIAKGFTVFAGCLTEKGRTSLKEECPSIRLHPVSLDVTSDESVRQAKEFVERNLGGLKLWGVVNNAGVFSCYGPDDWTTIEDYKRAAEVNTFGVIRVTHVGFPDNTYITRPTCTESFFLQAFKKLVKRAEGRIVAVTSVNGRLSSPGAGPYVVSKFGTEAYMDAIRQELHEMGVKVSILEPGIFRTALIDEQAMLNRVESVWSKLDDETKEEYGEEFKDYFGKMWNHVYVSLSSTKTHYVVDNYLHALTAKYPRHRYYCGWDAILLFIPMSLLPTWWSDFVVRIIGHQEIQPAVVEKRWKKKN
ncbi:oxidoreductase, short chain dehydrogenase/reductase family protein [Ancylostoma caninum]|uniref:Oxidoreductase, short chain dehydrogenase/reductase family protein n=1 Tax=Ancylostoma caninum TaxID=29170 RepID=A0A368GY31_ANCCA|nr:oxidoreductase, short chain dehydrogenase/reductase family protein [Ancylostoma caninum]